MYSELSMNLNIFTNENEFSGVVAAYHSRREDDTDVY